METCKRLNRTER